MKSYLKKFTEKYLIPTFRKEFFDHPDTKELLNNPEKLFYVRSAASVGALFRCFKV